MSLQPTVRMEHALLAVDHDGHVDVMLEIAAPQAEASAARPAASVAIVVDESGSMAGDKLATAARCVAWLGRRLAPADRACLVGFADDARLVAPLGAGVDLARGARGLRPRGSTNLSGGILVGLEQLAAAPADGPRVLLVLTDGWANQGITDTGGLTGLVAGAASRGIRVSTIGFGDDFSEDLLRAMADAGRGDAHHAGTPDAAPRIFAHELAGLTELVAQAVSVEIRPGPHVTGVDTLNDHPSVAVPGGVRVEAGDAYAGDVRRLVMRLHAPDLRALGVCALAELVLRYTTLAPAPAAHTVTIPVAVNLVSADEAAAHHPDLEVTAEVRSLLADRAREQAIRDADEGRTGQSAAFLASTARELRGLAATLPAAAAPALSAKADELDEEARLFQEGYTASTRKLASYRAHAGKRSRGRRPDRP